jgi:NAD(P)-dependent dehydrogenase (short-subunit alcohol dehydrogenase family)
MNIVILGGSKWLGKRLAQTLLPNAERLILLSRSPIAPQLVCGARAEAHRVDCRVMDLADIEAVKATAKQIAKDYDKLDLVLNVAGGTYVGRLADSQPTEFCQMFDAYIRGITLFNTLLLPPLRNAASPLVMNFLADWAVRKPGMECGNAIYGVTKSALASFSDYLASEEWPHGIAVTNVFLGHISEQDDETLLERDERGHSTRILMSEICTLVTTILAFRSIRVADVTLIPQQRSYARQRFQAEATKWDAREDPNACT